jgi:hypothetical protein
MLSGLLYTDSPLSITRIPMSKPLRSALAGLLIALLAVTNQLTCYILPACL